jgi:ParB family chromosome partitioning protein
MTNATAKPKPRLKNLDALFQLNDGVNPLEQEAPAPDSAPSAKRAVITVSIDRLRPFPGHPFRLYEGERLDDMAESIRKNGVLVPILVRQIDAGIEILSGHNRVNAAKLAGLETVPAIMLENVSDAEAWIYVVETNLMQRSFSDMSHTEKAAVIAVHHSKLFSQGKRNDILRELKMLEEPSNHGENGTCAQVEHKLKAREIVAKEYSLSKDTVARYLRINQLIPALKSRLDNGDFAFIPAVTLSFLKEAEQSLLENCLGENTFAVDMKKADALRQYSDKGKLNSDNILMILNGKAGQKPPPNRTSTVKINTAVYARYFKPNQSAKEIQGIVEKALEMYFSNQ